MGQVNDRVRGHEIDAEAGIAIVAGFAGAGTVEDQVAAGRELNAIVYWTILERPRAIAAIDAAVVAGALTRAKRSSCSLAPRPPRRRRALPPLWRRSRPTWMPTRPRALAALGAAVTAPR